MKRFTKLFMTLALLVVGVGGANAQNTATLDQLKAANGTDAAWQAAIPQTYPLDVKDAVLFGSDASAQETNANVNDYDYIYFEVTDFSTARAVRVFFWDPNQNKRIDYFLKPVADKETADYAQNTTVSANGTYCVKIPDGARLQGAKTPWIQIGATEPYFKFSQIYLTERATPYVELVPYTLVFSKEDHKAIVPISESHIRTTGNVSINYTTGEVTNTGSGTLTIYLNNEDLVGATLYHVDIEGTNLEPTLNVTDAVNGEVGGIYGSRFNWNIANDASRKDKVGAVTALTYIFSNTGTMTFKSIYFEAYELIAETSNKNLTEMPYGVWGSPANKVSQFIELDNYKTNNIGNGAKDLTYGHDGIGDANKYVDLTNCSKLYITGSSSNGKIRLFYNWSGTDSDKPIEIITDFPATGMEKKYVFDIDAFKKKKGISFFHLNGIKSEYNQTATISEITVDEYTNKISGRGINRAKNYLTNPYLTSIDATGVTVSTALTTANPNCLITANADMVTNDKNVIVDGTCANLVLEDKKPFQAPVAFTATSAKFTKTVSDAEYATMVLPFAVGTLPEGVEAFNITGNEGDVLTTAEAEGIEANKPVMLKNAGTYEFTASDADIAATATGVQTNGLLNGAYAATAVPTENSYVLQNKSGDVNFYKAVAGLTIDPFRAYLTTATAGARLSFDFDQTTGIKTVETAKDVNVYNLQGVRVANPTKGLYIVNGKKAIVK